MPTLISFHSLAGVPVHYDRLPIAPYGSRGRPYTFRATRAFVSKLEAFFAELWKVCPEGKPEVITSAGAYTEKPGYHGKGQAFDLDGIFWKEKAFVTLYDGYNARDRSFYYGVEAVARRHFGTILNFHFNAAHRDHLHLDDGEAVGFKAGSRSRVLFVQGALNQVLGARLHVDGEYAKASKAAVAQALTQWGITGSLSNRGTWQEFLLALAGRAFEHQTAPSIPVPTVPSPAVPGAPALEKSPLELLHDVYGIIGRELGETNLRKPVESALNSFANHAEVQQWLKQFR